MMLDWMNAAALCKKGRAFCLTAPVETILARIGHGDNLRPLLAAEDPETAVRALLAARQDGYARFEQIATEGRTVAEVVDDIVARLEAPNQSIS